MKQKVNVQLLMHVSLLVAAEVVLSRFCSISTPIVKIGFGFVPIAICGMLYGPLWAGVAAALADFLGAVLFPIGAYFPGFTLSALLTGVLFGLLLKGGKQDWPRLLLAAGVNNLVISLLLNTFWLSVLMGLDYRVMLPTRLLQCCIMLPVQLVVLLLLRRPVLYLAKNARVVS